MTTINYTVPMIHLRDRGWSRDDIRRHLGRGDFSPVRVAAASCIRSRPSRPLRPRIATSLPHKDAKAVQRDLARIKRRQERDAGMRDEVRNPLGAAEW